MLSAVCKRMFVRAGRRAKRGPIPPFRTFHRNSSSKEMGKLRIYWDGGCSLCRKEIAFYHRLNETRRELDFHDLHSKGVDPLRECFVRMLESALASQLNKQTPQWSR